MGVPRECCVASVFAVAGMILCVPCASAQWVVTNLHPASGTGGSTAAGLSSSHQAGWVGDEAALWSGSAGSWVSLHVNFNPQGSAISAALGVAGGQQVGYHIPNPGRPRTYACVWYGTAASMQYLHPANALASMAYATDGTSQVGYSVYSGGNHAGLWNSTPESWVDLHPTTAPVFVWHSAALALSGEIQAGYTTVGAMVQDHACLWRGTAESWTDLHPAGALDSRALAASGVAQAGYAAFVSGVPHAGIWTGSAASWLDLHPAGASSSMAAGIAGSYQAGSAYFNDASHAGIWRGSAESWFDLHSVLPAEFESSQASSIWTDGSTIMVSGSGYNSLTGRDEALVWTIPSPGTAAPAVLVFAALRRRRPAPRPRTPTVCEHARAG